MSDAEERFWVKVDKSGECWLWSAARSDGYGVFRLNGRLRKAHRVAWEMSRGEIPAGMQLDHMCHNRACVRLSHLRMVTNQQNGENRRGAQSNSASGIRGVCWFKPYRKWRVEVTISGKSHHGGYFDDLAEAGRVASQMRRELMTHSLADRGDAA